jgi:hypothetical protein
MRITENRSDTEGPAVRGSITSVGLRRFMACTRKKGGYEKSQAKTVANRLTIVCNAEL